MDAQKVLIVDDEEELVLTLIERLQMRGMLAEGVYNGHAALERIEEGGIDVVVVDLKMPGLSGLDLSEAIARRFPEVAVILITGHGAEQHDEKEHRIENLEVLLKPFKLEDFMAVVERLRETRRSAK